MKKALLFFGLLISLALFAPTETIDNDEIAMSAREAVVKEKDQAAEMKYRIESIGRDLRGSNCLTPRRHVQSTHYSYHPRVFKIAERFLQDIRLKDDRRLLKVNEYISHQQIINYSSLLVRSGYHVYALRKIII